MGNGVLGIMSNFSLHFHICGYCLHCHICLFVTAKGQRLMQKTLRLLLFPWELDTPLTNS